MGKVPGVMHAQIIGFMFYLRVALGASGGSKNSSNVNQLMNSFTPTMWAFQSGLNNLATQS
jgi:hypothetical protein